MTRESHIQIGGVPANLYFARQQAEQRAFLREVLLGQVRTLIIFAAGVITGVCLVIR